MRAYSAGGVVFRLAPIRSPEKDFAIDRYELEHAAFSSHNVVIQEGVLVGRRHTSILALPKGTRLPGETVEQVAVREAQGETGVQGRLITCMGTISYFVVSDQVRYHK